MYNEDIDELTKQLRAVRISRDRKITRLSRSIDEARVEEGNILRRIQLARVAERARNNAANHYDIGNVFALGDTLVITNDLRNERGTVGVVITSGRRFVEIRTERGVVHKRAYWNLAYSLLEGIDNDNDDNNGL